MRLILVEDNAQLASTLAQGFGEDGYEVEIVDTAAKAIARGLRRDLDLMVLDLGLPDRDGLDVLRELHRERPSLPVMILSARADLATKLRGFELGAVDYVAKPFSLDELLARTRVQLRRANTSDGGSVLRAGTLALDITRRQARVGDVVADLPDREFRVLHFLMLHVGQVVSRERLLSEVWGYDFDPRSNVVDVCVRRLRRQLGPNAPIETIRNAGYRAAA